MNIMSPMRVLKMLRIKDQRWVKPKIILQLKEQEEIHKTRMTHFRYNVTYALLVIEESISSTYREVEISSESEIWKNVMSEEIKSLHKNDTW